MIQQGNFGRVGNKWGQSLLLPALRFKYMPLAIERWTVPIYCDGAA
jgi:hypothetical protein